MRIIEENGKYAAVADPNMVINFGDCYCHKLYRKENDFSDCVEVDASAVPVIEEEATAEDYETALAEMGVEV